MTFKTIDEVIRRVENFGSQANLEVETFNGSAAEFYNAQQEKFMDAMEDLSATYREAYGEDEDKEDNGLMDVHSLAEMEMETLQYYVMQSVMRKISRDEGRESHERFYSALFDERIKNVREVEREVLDNPPESMEAYEKQLKRKSQIIGKVGEIFADLIKKYDESSPEAKTFSTYFQDRFGPLNQSLDETVSKRYGSIEGVGTRVLSEARARNFGIISRLDYAYGLVEKKGR